MKLTLIGYGKMGRMVEATALERGHTISAKIDSRQRISEASLGDTDLCIDFTHPEHAVANIYACAELGKSIVVGTTGWYEHLPKIKTLVEEHKIGFLYSPNFSLGVHLFFRLAAQASKWIERLPQYDVAILEEHHKQKVDRPSGTAQALAALVKAEISRDVEIASLRCGSIPGTHSLLLDSLADSITLTHTARSRHGMAEGAVRAAEWLHGKQGFFTLDHMLEAIL